VRADAQRRIYALEPAGFDELERWMTRIRRYWRDNLDALDRVLKEEDRKPGKGKR
jgi:DNA-binding PadR family transcriptional regulator